MLPYFAAVLRHISFLGCLLYVSSSVIVNLWNAEWKLSSCDGEVEGVLAHIPGNVHLDLLDSGVIDAHLYGRFREDELSWIANKCWRYSGRSSEFNAWKYSSSEIYLIADGLDTSATIYLNGVEIGHAQNMFRSHYIGPISTSLLASDGIDVIEIKIDSPLIVAQHLAKRYPYDVPATKNYNIWAEPTHRNFLRKAGADFGWDWGPAFVPTGIYGGLSMLLFNNCQLKELVLHQHLNKNLTGATLDVFMDIVGDICGGAYVSVYVDGVYQMSTSLPQQPSQSSCPGDGTVSKPKRSLVAVGTISLPNVELWWPRDMGNQRLYEVEVKLFGCPMIQGYNSFAYSDDGPDSSLFQTIRRRVGFRRVELVQMDDKEFANLTEQHSPYSAGNIPSSDLQGMQAACRLSGAHRPRPSAKKKDPSSHSTFFFCINGVPTFLRGANFVPLDAFHSRVKPADRRYALEVAFSANMNTLRVWGGGIYQPDDFYDRADELGIMIWQEFMFACALYPRDDSFLKEVALEVREQSARLNHHASIVVWGGNNENEAAMSWFEESLHNRDLYVADYTKLMVDTVFETLRSVDGDQRAWVDSSPSNGVVSWKPYVKRWGATSTPQSGDMHFYAYDCDCEDPSSYPPSNFVSEFGFQVLPSFASLASLTLPEDWNWQSDFMRHRQRHEEGNEQIRSQMLRHFNVDALGVNPRDEFDAYLFLSALQQSRCYEVAIRKWRQPSSLSGKDETKRPVQRKTMGVLYWQLNDVWPGPSWASMEWGGYWKPLQHAVQRAFAPLLLALSRERNSTGFDTVHAFIANDYTFDVVVEDVSVELIPWIPTQSDGGIITSTGQVLVPRLSALSFGSWKMSRSLLNSFGCSKETCFVKFSAKRFVPQVKADVSIKESRSATPNLHRDNQYQYLAAFEFLSEIKRANLDRTVSVEVMNATQVSPKEIIFTAIANATTPFLFFELHRNEHEHSSGLKRTTTLPHRSTQGSKVYANDSIALTAFAGWFEPNNFLAESYVAYKIRYKSSSPINVESFISRLRTRTLPTFFKALK